MLSILNFYRNTLNDYIIFFILFFSFFFSFWWYLDILWERFTCAWYSIRVRILSSSPTDTRERYIAESMCKIACVLEFPREYVPSRNMIASYLFLSTTMNEIFFVINIGIQPHRDFSGFIDRWKLKITIQLYNRPQFSCSMDGREIRSVIHRISIKSSEYSDEILGILEDACYNVCFYFTTHRYALFKTK